MLTFRLTFDLRTRSETAVLVYHSAKSYDSDYMVLELLHGRVSLTLNKGSGALEFVSDSAINDGAWHQVEVVIDPLNIRLAVDGHRKERRANAGDSRFLDLDGFLFVGGLDAPTRARAIQYELPSLSGSNARAGSMVGCLQNFKINGEPYGLREVLLSRTIRPDCLWSFPCSRQPCIQHAECIEEGYYHYRCVCDQPNCFRSDGGGQSPLTPISSIVHMQDVVVREGAAVTLTENHIDLLVDHAAYAISDNQVVFTVTSPPAHGELRLRARPIHNLSSFTLSDILSDSVVYQQDGSEVLEDHIGLAINFTRPQPGLPDKFSRSYWFNLVVKVAPWNDPPDLLLPINDTLYIVQNTFITLTPEVMSALDGDDPPESLEFSIQYQQTSDIGYFEISGTLGIRARINSFSQRDVEQGRVRFIHRGRQEQQFRIQVSEPAIEAISEIGISRKPFHFLC